MKKGAFTMKNKKIFGLFVLFSILLCSLSSCFLATGSFSDTDPDSGKESGSETESTSEQQEYVFVKPTGEAPSFGSSETHYLLQKDLPETNVEYQVLYDGAVPKDLNGLEQNVPCFLTEKEAREELASLGVADDHIDFKNEVVVRVATRCHAGEQSFGLSELVMLDMSDVPSVSGDKTGKTQLIFVYQSQYDGTEVDDTDAVQHVSYLILQKSDLTQQEYSFDLVGYGKQNDDIPQGTAYLKPFCVTIIISQ